MKRISLLFLWTGLVLAPLLPQRPSPEAKRGAVPLAVRVFDGGRFVASAAKISSLSWSMRNHGEA